jgi:uncharacterized YigZ family protein
MEFQMKYITVKSPAESSYIEKRSEFIGHISPAETNEDAINFINHIKENNRKARHNVYAYILRDGNISRYSDDGEPQGTAGIPVLEVLRKNNLTDVCCVVTRYFGGILLGGGGLVRAYSHSTALAIEAAEVLKMYKCSELILSLSYDLYGKITYIFSDYEIKQINSDFSDGVKITARVKSELEKPFCNKLTDITFGKIKINKTAEIYDDFPK